MTWISGMMDQGATGGTTTNGGIGQTGIQGGESIPVSDSLSPQTNAALAQGGAPGQIAATLFSQYAQPYADMATGIKNGVRAVKDDPMAALKSAGDFGLDVVKQRAQQRMASGQRASAPTPDQRGHNISIGNLLSSYTGGAWHSGAGASTPRPPAQAENYGASFRGGSGGSTGGMDFDALFNAMARR